MKEHLIEGVSTKEGHQEEEETELFMEKGLDTSKMCPKI
jgi:hypothetical protein